MNNYPTKEDVDVADHEQLARWSRFLRSPNGNVEVNVMGKIVARLSALGGIPTAISKRIGWDP